MNPCKSDYSPLTVNHFNKLYMTNWVVIEELFSTYTLHSCHSISTVVFFLAIVFLTMKILLYLFFFMVNA